MTREQSGVLNIKEITFHVQAALDKPTNKGERHGRDDLLCSESQPGEDSRSICGSWKMTHWWKLWLICVTLAVSCFSIWPLEKNNSNTFRFANSFCISWAGNEVFVEGLKSRSSLQGLVLKATPWERTGAGLILGCTFESHGEHEQNKFLSVSQAN